MKKPLIPCNRRDFLARSAGVATAGWLVWRSGHSVSAVAQEAAHDSWPRGIMMFAITPMIDKGSTTAVDYEGVAQNMEHFAQTPGAKSVCICGGTGEVWDLTAEENARVVAAACTVKGQTKVVSGVSGTTADEYIRKANAAANAGTDAVLIMANKTLTDAGDEAMYRFYKEVLDNVDIGCAVYRTGDSPFSVDTALRLAEHPRFIIMKYGGQDMDWVRDFHNRNTREIPIFPASESLMPYWHIAGASGITTGICLLVQEQSQKQWAACEAGKYSEAMAYRDMFQPLLKLRKEYGNAILKGGLEIQGLAGGPMRTRTPRILDADGRKKLRKVLENLDALM